MKNPKNDVCIEFHQELDRARSKFGPIHNLHEGYAIIKEEFDEFWEVVREQYTPERLVDARKELIQVAAMVIRTIEDVIDNDFYENMRG